LRTGVAVRRLVCVSSAVWRGGPHLARAPMRTGRPALGVCEGARACECVGNVGGSNVKVPGSSDAGCTP
jgi:hypothetical protein